MKKNNKCKTKGLLKASFCFALLLIAFLLPNCSFATENETEETDNDGFIYLSDIPYDTRQSRAGYGSIHINETESRSNFSVKVEGGFYSFSKGIWAHASSQVVYNITDYQGYDYLTTYMGVNSSSGNNGNGVKFKIYTSENGSDWTLRTDENPPAIKSSNNAQFVKISLENVKFIKLEANDNGANGNDHSVYVDTKLIKSTYKEPGVDLVPSIEELDEKIKTTFADADLTNEEYKLTLLKRELISRVGPYGLRRFLLASDINKETYEWLTGDVKVLEYFILGGQPEGGYYNTLTQLTRLYEAYKDDFKITKTTRYGTVLGDLYTRMAIAMSLTHSQTLGLWLQSGGENKSDAVKRYQIYKDMHKNGNFVILRNEDGTPQLNQNGTPKLDVTQWFENYSVEEMRYIFNNLSDDEETLWLNEYTQSFVDQYQNQYGTYLSPHPYMDYRWENLNQPEFYDPDKKGEWDAHFKGLFSKYDVTYKPGLKKIWMLLRNPIVTTGAVCGGISKVGSAVRTSHGIPCVVIGQPGHAAMIYYWQNADGKGYWNLDNDVSGWTLSERGERLLLGWGNANTNYARGSYQVVYMLLAQEALNDYENLVKAEELVYLANVYNNDLTDETKKQVTLEKQEEIYRKALEIQPINIDAWIGLINAYNANKNKTENDYYGLAEEVAEKLKCFPLPMYQLTNLIKPKLASVENSYKFTLLQTRILTEASNLPNTATDQVLQPSITRTEANFLLGKIDKTIATFSFDGADAGSIVLSSRFDGIGVRWDYSLDGKQTWNEVSFPAEEEHKLQLTNKQISSITAENDIYVHIVGVGYEEENLYKIDILSNVINEDMYYANDLENRVIGVNLNYEWRRGENDTWTSYAASSPDNTGNKTLQIRQASNGTKLSSNILTFTFTEDNQPNTRKYIPVSHLSKIAVSTEAVNNGGAAVNALDGNYNTRYHSAWNGTDENRFLVVKLDKPVHLSAVEFVPAGGGNGRMIKGEILGSMTGEDGTWVSLTNNNDDIWSWPTQANDVVSAKQLTKSFEIPEENRENKVQFVKIVAHQATNGKWFAARAFNFYQDLTKVDEHPTAGIAYSTTENTSEPVVARLVNPSTEITITSDDGKDTYVFMENGEHEFKFIDAQGNEGSALAKVTWIDKNAPTADVKYKLNEDKKLLVLLDNISENVYLLDEDNNKINYIEVEKNGEKTTVKRISYLDDLGNTYKILDKDANENTTKITYKSTIGNVATYITTLENGKVTIEEYFDNEGNAVTVTEREKEELRKLQQITRSNPLERALETSGDYEFKMLDKADNLLCKSIKVDYIDNDTIILASDITYDVTELTNKNVVATINPYIIDTEGNKDVNVKITNNNEKTTYTFEENGEFTFTYKNALDINGLEVKSHKASVNWIDKITPVATVTYNVTEETNQEVIATVTFNEENVTVKGGNTHTFTENGEFIFEFKDKAGNTGTAKAKVDWINKALPVTTIAYSTTELTNQDVIATVTFDKENVTVKGGNTHTFTENGQFTFEYTTEEGSTGVAVANVDWIDKIAPVATIVYSTTELTNQDVIATLVFNENNVAIVGGNGHRFTQNGEYTFSFSDLAGNTGTAKAIVTWIVKNPTNPENPNKYQLGDINSDGKITATDLLLLKRHLVAGKKQEWILTGDKFKAGDINENGKITATDLLLIKRLVLKQMKISI